MSRFLKSEAAMQFGEKKVRKAGRDRLPIYFRKRVNLKSAFIP